jgi:hypothetical protein
VIPVAKGGATDTVAFVQALAAAMHVEVGNATHEERLRERVAAIHAAGRGRLIARSEGGYAEAPASTADDAWKALVVGGCWIDETAERAALEVRPALPGPATLAQWRQPAADGLALVAFGARGTVGTTPPSPLLTKLYQESDLRPAGSTAIVAPGTAALLGFVQGQPARIEAADGVVRAALRTDPAMPAGRVALAAGPDAASLHPGTGARPGGALPLVAAAADGTWRETRVRVREA